VSDLSDEKYLLLILNAVVSSSFFFSFVIWRNLAFLWDAVLVIILEMKRNI